MDQLWAPWRLEYIQGPEESECIFCVDDDHRYRPASPDPGAPRVLLSDDEPLSLCKRPFDGLSLQAPGRSSELEEGEVLEVHQLMIESQAVLREVCAAQGFNVGWNLGRAAGAGIADHIHMHIVPRWVGDNNFMPILADTRVIPQHIEKTYALLADAFARL